MTDEKKRIKVADGLIPNAMTPVPKAKSSTGDDKLERGLQPPKVTPVPPATQPGNQGGQGSGGSPTPTPKQPLKK
jgi:hypothetical protein